MAATPPNYNTTKHEIYKGLQRAFNGDIQTALNNSKLNPLDPDIQKIDTTIFNESPFKLVNVMSQCRIYRADGKQINTDLSSMHNPSSFMFYKQPCLMPSLQMCIPSLSPTVLFSRKGFVTMTGGSSLAEIQYCMSLYCYRILHFLFYLYPGIIFLIDNYKVYNKVYASRIQYKIDMISFVDFAIKHNIRVQYVVDSINIAYVYPVYPNVCVSIGSMGGITIIMGSHCPLEVQHVIKILSYLLKDCTRPISATEIESIRTHQINTSRTKMNRKARKLSKWQKLA